MSRLTRRVAIRPKGGPAPSRTYNEWLVHMTSTSSTNKTWATGSMTTVGAETARFRTTCGSPTGSMTGTPWQAHTSTSSNVARAVQHACPSLAALTAMAGLSYNVFLTVVLESGSINLPALNRNGYTSAPDTASSGVKATRLDYYDPDLGPMYMLPFDGLGPFPYTW